MTVAQIIAATVLSIGAIGYVAVAVLAGRRYLGRTITLPLRTHAIAQVVGIVGWTALLAWGKFWS